VLQWLVCARRLHSQQAGGGPYCRGFSLLQAVLKANTSASHCGQAEPGMISLCVIGARTPPGPGIAQAPPGPHLLVVAIVLLEALLQSGDVAGRHAGHRRLRGLCGQRKGVRWSAPHGRRDAPSAVGTRLLRTCGFKGCIFVCTGGQATPLGARRAPPLRAAMRSARLTTLRRVRVLFIRDAEAPAPCQLEAALSAGVGPSWIGACSSRVPSPVTRSSMRLARGLALLLDRPGRLSSRSKWLLLQAFSALTCWLKPPCQPSGSPSRATISPESVPDNLHSQLQLQSPQRLATCAVLQQLRRRQHAALLCSGATRGWLALLKKWLGFGFGTVRTANAPRQPRD
jgi:hypothetical protein